MILMSRHNVSFTRFWWSKNIAQVHNFKIVIPFVDNFKTFVQASNTNAMLQLGLTLVIYMF